MRRDRVGASPGFLLAVKAAVRKTERVEDGDVVAIAVALAN